jgi:thiamine biosynthesis protein ThiI
MKEIILIKNGEIALKGLNRSNFEDLLIKNLKWRLKPVGSFIIRKAQSTIYCEPADDSIDLDDAIDRVGRVFGIAAFSRALAVEKDFSAIAAAAPDYLEDTLRAAKTFKVEARRSDKRFPMTSPEICRELGGVLLSRFPHLKVNVEKPDVVVYAEIREREAYLHAGKIRGAGGIPIGSSGRAALLVSGGIDSPVAGYMMAKRGLELIGIHFVSPPYTSDRALQKVVTLMEKMSRYCGRMKLFVVPFTKIQEEIRDRCPEDLFTIIMRRIMMKIADKIAKDNDCAALITGESVGQVASQTVGALACTDVATRMPVFRPVIGMDKEEIIRIAREIDTFETSILPYEDCCTVFTPKHPRTKPKLHFVEEAENLLDCEALMAEAVAGVDIIEIRPQ